MDNMTAKVSCFSRAYHYKNNAVHIFADTAAEQLLGEDYGQIAESMTAGLPFFFPDFKGTKEEGLRLIMEKQLAPSVLGRSAYCEDALAGARKQGCTQYVLFACGYDTFSLRNQDAWLQVFELDFPELLRDKAERIEKAKLRSSAVSVPCNLAEPAWKEQLSAAGFDRGKESFGSLLGISYYLTKEEFERLLRNISELMAEGSLLCFDYPCTEESRETRTNQALAAAAGEQMQALYAEQEMQSLLERCGFAMAEHLHHQEMTDRYFSAYNAENPEHRMAAPVGVGYVLAVKGKGSQALYNGKFPSE